MKKKTLFLASVAVAAGAAFGITTWSGADGIYKIDTGFGDGSESDPSGYWYSYADDKDGGASTVTWPVATGNDYDETALDPIIDHCQGVCGTYTLNKGTLTYKPFVGIGFNLVDGDQTPTNATSWGGVCIAYSVGVGASLEMGLGDEGDQNIGYDNPYITLPKTEGAVVEKTWADFKQAGWGKVKITGTEAATKLGAIKFKIQAVDGTTGQFNIMSVGAYGGGCATTNGGAAISPVASVSSVKASLNGHNLALSGIKNTATVEVMNLQGQVVLKSVVNGSANLNLSNLNNGVYMVRVAGQSVNMNQKIVLK